MSHHKAGDRAGHERALTAGDLMRPPGETVEVDAHVAAAAYLLRHERTRALVVTTDDDARKPVAVVTEADVAKAVAEGRNIEDLRIFELGSRRLASVEPTTRLADAAEIMRATGLQYLPVVEAGRLSGVLHIGDVDKALLADGRVLDDLQTPRAR